jgi:hypothetical protein
LLAAHDHDPHRDDDPMSPKEGSHYSDTGTLTGENPAPAHAAACTGVEFQAGSGLTFRGQAYRLLDEGDGVPQTIALIG